MKRKFLFSLALIVLLCPAHAAFAAGADDYSRAAVVDDLSGSVTATQNEMEMPAFKGLSLLRGDSVGTGAESWSKLELDEGRFAIIQENAVIQITELADKMPGGSKTTLVYVSEGKVWFDVAKELSEGENFEVRTPTCALSVRGTIFSAEVGEETIVTIYDGVVTIRMMNTDGTPMLDENGKEVVLQISGDKMTVSVDENGHVSVSMKGGLTAEDFIPFKEGEEEGPGGVYELLRKHLMENEEEFMQQLSQQIEREMQELLGEDGLGDITEGEMAQVLELLKRGPAFPYTLLAPPAQEIIDSSRIIAPDPVTASIAGNLQGGGRYGFDVNLTGAGTTFGAISNGTMKGQYSGIFNYNLSGGYGAVGTNGKDFNVSGFGGSVTDIVNNSPTTSVSGNLNGTAAKGFTNMGDIGASGTFDISFSYGGLTPYYFDGSIIDGERVK